LKRHKEKISSRHSNQKKFGRGIGLTKESFQGQEGGRETVVRYRLGAGKKKKPTQSRGRKFKGRTEKRRRTSRHSP